MDALIVKKPWIDYILDGIKAWEIRGTSTKKRGKIELIQSGTGLVVGTCDLVDCIKINVDILENTYDKHCIKNIEMVKYKEIYAWVISNPKRYKVPKPYNHPKGAIIWVKL